MMMVSWQAPTFSAQSLAYFNGPVDLWDPALDPDTGLAQIFLLVDRFSVDNTRSSSGIVGDL